MLILFCNADYWPLTITTENIGHDVLQFVPANVARHYRIVPIALDGDVLAIAMDETQTMEFLQHELKIVLGFLFRLHPIPVNDIDRLLSTFYMVEKSEKHLASTFAAGQDGFLDAMVAEAYSLRASDIHVERYEDDCRVRFRIDGHLVKRHSIPAKDYAALINKIKIKANLDISEKRLPQDGRIQIVQDNLKFDIRVSSMPTLYAEKIVLRILGTDASHLSLENLGLSAEDLKRYLEGIRRTHGIILISGPTGSGKTTTLYATLKELNKESKNVLTIEDPIEYTLAGINQVQLKEDIGLTFGKALRTFLRQDPDIIMVGEIRDNDTATTAVRAALTGHLVLSTIHTNSAWGTVARLTDMGVPAYLLSSTLVMSVAQRLVRKLCRCKKKEAFKANIPSDIENFVRVREHFVPVGCEQCYYTGYRGRVAVYEVIPITDEFKSSIRTGQQDVTELMTRSKVTSLQLGAHELLINGVTSFEEIYSLILST